VFEWKISGGAKAAPAKGRGKRIGTGSKGRGIRLHIRAGKEGEETDCAPREQRKECGKKIKKKGTGKEKKKIDVDLVSFDRG